MPNMAHLFIHLVLNANTEDNKWRGIQVKRGQLVTGRKKLRENTGISEQSIRTCLKRLVNSGEITIKPTRLFSIITLCNYDKFQEKETIANQRPTNDQPTANQQLTNDQPHLKNNKNIKNKRISTASANEIFDFWNSKKIITHKTIKQFEKHITAKLKEGYVVADIKDAISNYAEIIFDDSYYWTHKYGLKEFLTRTGNIDRFMSANKPHEEFKVSTPSERNYVEPVKEIIWEQ